MILYTVLDAEVSIEKRIYYLWYSVFFLRLWRAWLLNHDTHSTEHNFITLNAYICVEINAHGMYIVLQHIDNNSFKEFFPYMYGSQPCESFFRLLGSISSTFSTMVNCDFLDAMHRIKKIELLCELANKKYENNNLVFPRKNQFRSSFDRLDKKQYAAGLPNIPDIPKIEKNLESPEDKIKAENFLKEILISKKNAYEDCQSLSIVVSKKEANYIQVKVKSQDQDDSFQINEDDCDESDIDDITEDFEKENEAVNERRNTSSKNVSTINKKKKKMISALRMLRMNMLKITVTKMKVKLMKTNMKTYAFVKLKAHENTLMVNKKILSTGP